MANLIIAVLAALVVIFAALFIVLRRNIINITKQLTHISTTKTNSKILIPSSDSRLTDLALSINKILDEKLDIESEYKRMDLELRQAIANISHDLRTPLTSIMGYMQLIEDSSLQEADKKEYIEIVKKRSQALQVLITGFYDLSRLESKEYRFELKPVDLSAILCDILASFYKDFIDNGIEPMVDIEENVPSVIADENAVKRIISNLIQNILKHSKGLVHISNTQEKGYISMIFENSAPDLSQEDVSHLFERFFTADRMRTGNSTGLGLAITKQLVEQMGHTIYASLDNGLLSIEIKWKIK